MKLNFLELQDQFFSLRMDGVRVNRFNAIIIDDGGAEIGVNSCSHEFCFWIFSQQVIHPNRFGQL